MTRYAQLVIGPAGSGKSSYCSLLQKHCEAVKRNVQVVNLDPAAEHFNYPVHADIRELISVDDVMEDDSMRFGPNGGLVFCMEYLSQNFDWLYEQLDEVEDDYILFDCPGQIELYTHIPVMRQLVDQLQSWNFRVCAVFLVDSQFLIEPSKFVCGVLSALSAMVTIEIPHVNVMTKLDLLNKQAKNELERYLDPEMDSLLEEEMCDQRFGAKFEKLNRSIAHLIDDYSLVRFTPLDSTDEESIGDLLMQIDNAIQYGEDLEPKEPKDFGDRSDDGDS